MVTFCTALRSPVLASPAAHAAGLAAFRQLVADGDAEVLAASIMPDHVHLLFRLGARLKLDRALAKWRAQVRRAMPDLRWQPNYFEHRLRAEESAESCAFYIFMNPYSAGLVKLDQPWNGWWTDDSVVWQFLDKARTGPCPQPEWLAEVERVAEGLVTGE